MPSRPFSLPARTESEPRPAPPYTAPEPPHTAPAPPHTAYAFVGLTFALSWGGVLVLGAPQGMPIQRDRFDEAWPVVFATYLLGPLVAGLVLMGWSRGRAGYRDLGRQLARWRVGWRIWALALGVVPAVLTVALVPLALASSDFVPAVVRADSAMCVVGLGLAVGLFGGGLLEEPGWTGFLLPVLRERHPRTGASLRLGLVWGVWHLLPTYWSSGDAEGAFNPGLFWPPCVFYLGVLPAYRMILVWAYERTASLPLVVIMHAMLTACSLFILVPAATGWALAGYYALLAVLFWVVVLLVTRRSASPRGPQRPG